MSHSQSDEGSSDFPLIALVLPLSLALLYISWYCTKFMNWQRAVQVQRREVAAQSRSRLETGGVVAQSRSSTEEQQRDDLLNRQQRIEARQLYIMNHLQSFPYSTKETTVKGITGDIEVGPVDERDQTEYNNNNNNEKLNQGNQCAICLEEYKQGDYVTTSDTEQCMHTFHYKCMADWLIRKAMCPVCRNPFMLVDLKHQQAK